MSKSATEFKQRGNDCFKKAQFSKAADLYSKAEKSDQKDPVYPSNLSAALYEAGDYALCIDAILRAWKILKDRPGEKAALVVKLSTRLAKALCHGASAKTVSLEDMRRRESEIKGLRETKLEGLSSNANSAASDELSRAWQAWTEMESDVLASTAMRDRCLNDFARMPHLSQPLDEGLQYYTIGMDRIIDLTKGWYPETSPYPLAFGKLSLEQLSKLSFLFGGVGDGRHALGTLVGLSQAFKKLASARQSVFHAHLTLLDIQPATIARNLCMFMLLHELNETTNPVARLEIKATLMYSFLAVVMPGYCYNRFKILARDLQERLSETPPRLPPLLHVDAESIPPVKAALAYWLTTQKATPRVLAVHAHTDPLDQQDTAARWFDGGGNGRHHQDHREEISEANRMYEMVLRTLPVSTLMDLPHMPAGLSERQARAHVDANMAMYVDILRGEVSGNAGRREAEWYKATKVFIPPVALRKRHPGFDAAWRQLKSSGAVDRATRLQVLEHVNSDWKANITFYNARYNNRKYEPSGDGYRKMEFGMFDSVDFLAEFSRKGKSTIRDPDILTWDVASTFFDQVADALRVLNGRVTIELISGGLSEVLAKSTFGNNPGRPDAFPKKFMRMWHSNVPDYTHGIINLAIYVMPSLENDTQAGAACNCLLNRGVWGSDEDYFTTYSFLLPQDVPRFLGCSVIRSEAVRDILVLGSLPLPRPLDELATRDELTTWLTQVLFNTFISGRAKQPPYGVRLPHNLVAFFALLLHLHRVGFPGHWLSEFLARVLSGSMVSDIEPYTDLWPIPEGYLRRRVPWRSIRTDPWLVEFETIIASAYYAIPFPVASALPAGFSRDPDDVHVWEAAVSPTLPFTTSFMGVDSPFEPVTRLLFYDPALGTARAIIRGLRQTFEGRAGSHAPGTFFVLTAQEDVDYQMRVSFRLSKRRMEKIQEGNWKMVVYRDDTGDEATRPIFVTICRRQTAGLEDDVD